MRVKCQIKVINNSFATRGFGATSGKSAQATLFVAKVSTDDVLLVYCTAKDKQGIKHKVKDNVECIFGRFIQEGKATIQLKDPPVSICISNAQPGELKSLLSAIKLASKGNTLTARGILSSLAPARAKHVQRPKTKIAITSKLDYPPSSGFPLTLEKLSVSKCNLVQIDSRIFALKNLVELNLSSNDITSIPDSLLSLTKLAMLNLSCNMIKQLPNFVFSQESNLAFLDVSHNNLKILPNSICKLKKLWHLNVSHNSIQCLPKHIGDLANLRTLSAAHNQIKFLPSSALLFRMLVSIDLFDNHFLQFHNSSICKRAEMTLHQNKILSLQEIAGRVIKKKKINYNNVNLVPYPLIHYLDSALPCYCQTYCFEDHLHFVALSKLEKLCPNVTRICEFGPNRVYFQVGVCSEKCLTMWRNYE